MFPLGTVLFPHGLLPLHVFEPRYRALVETCLADENEPEFGVVLIERGSEVGGGDTRFDVGTVARIVEASRFDDGRYVLVARGITRCAVREWLPDDPVPARRGRGHRRDPRRARRKPSRGRRWSRSSARARAHERARRCRCRTEMSARRRPGTRRVRSRALAPIGPLDAQRILEIDDPVDPTRLGSGACSRTRPRCSSSASPKADATSGASLTGWIRTRHGNGSKPRRTRVSGLIKELHTELDDENESDESELPTTTSTRPTAGPTRSSGRRTCRSSTSLEAELAEIEAAIERIDQGTYGIDEVTGEPIDPARLEAVPEARTNVGTAPERDRGALPLRSGRQPHRRSTPWGSRSRSWGSGPTVPSSRSRPSGRWRTPRRRTTRSPRTSTASSRRRCSRSSRSGTRSPARWPASSRPRWSLLVVHGEQDMRLPQADHARAWCCSSKAAPVGVHVKPNGTTVVVKVETRDQTGDLVVEQYMTSFFRGVSDGEGGGEEAPKHKLDGRDEVQRARRGRHPADRHRPDVPLRRGVGRQHADPPRRRDREVGRAARDHHPRALHDGVHVLGRRRSGRRRRLDPPASGSRCASPGRCSRVRRSPPTFWAAG